MNWNKRDFVRVALCLCAVVLFAYVIFNFDKVKELFGWVLDVVMPFIIGFAIAFVVNVPMKGLEKVIFKNEKSPMYRFKRPVCMVLSFLCIILVLTLVITMIVPEMSRTISTVVEKMPDAMTSIQDKAADIVKNSPEAVDKIKSINVNWEVVADNVLSVIKNGGGSLLSSTFSFASSVAHTVVDVVVGIFFACYVLAQKENLEKQAKGVLYALFKEEHADRIVKTCVLADNTFSNFISGQCLEACILGLMFLIVMSIFRIPYALTISILIAVFALIPVLGAFIGCFAGVLMILVESPRQAVAFIIIFIVIQQIEGNLIYPHVVGGSVGLPSIWVLVAVIVGGDVMGILGMLIFVPLVSVIYAISQEFVVKRLRERNIPRKKYCLPYGVEEPRLESEKSTPEAPPNTKRRRTRARRNQESKEGE
jgi:predicted PurR-regulated permease PerM